jgi:putative peptidoglycan lipid II flippase
MTAEAAPELTDPAEPPDAARQSNRQLARATATITAWNLVSRGTGFIRVIAMGAALGTTALGDTYQSANLVSNILFELLAGGLLSSVLVPTFVEMIDRGDRREATRLAGSLLGKALAGLGVLVAVAMVVSPWIMRALTAGAPDESVRQAQVHLGTFLLLFFLPQVLLYATGAVSTALLFGDRRFTAAAVAPVFNNVVVIATMVVFRVLRGGDTGFDLQLADKLVLALGTTAGVVAMTLVPLWAVRRSGLGGAPRWRGSDHQLRPLARKGMWAAGHLGLNQLLVAATIVLAARVEGGVVAYQIAFTFFLLPHAVLSNPIFTALFPRLSSDAVQGHFDDFARDLGTGIRYTTFLLVPAAVLLAVLAPAVMRVVRLGNLDADGAHLVAVVLAAYAVSLVGYSAFFLLTRASYALDDARSPTVVNLVATTGAVIAMFVASSVADGDAKVAVLGIVHAVAVTGASAALLVGVVRRLRRRVPVLSALARDVLFAALAGVAAWGAVPAVGTAGRTHAAVAVVLGGAAGAIVYAGGQFAVRAPELHAPLRTLRGRR